MPNDHHDDGVHASVGFHRDPATGLSRSVQGTEAKVGEIVTRKETFVSKLFPNKVQREKAVGELNLVTTEYEFLNRALAVVRETQIQTLQEVFNNGLNRGRAEMRGRTYELLASKLAELQKALNVQFEQLLISVEERYAKLSEIRYPTARLAAETELEGDLIRFRNFSDKLLEKFTNIIDEEVNK